MIGSMRTSWHDWAVWIRSHCTRCGTGVRNAPGPGDVTGPGCTGVGANGTYQCHAGTGEEYGRSAAQVLESEFRTKGRGGSSSRNPGSTYAVSAFDGGTE